DEILPDDPPLTADEIIADEPTEPRPRRHKKSSRTSQPESRRANERERRRQKADIAPVEIEPYQGEDQPAAADPDGPRGVVRRDPRTADEDSVVAAAEGDRSPAESLLKERFRPRAQRPGDRDPVRSPLVLTLGGGAAALLLIGATFYFMLGRQTTQADFNDAQLLMDEGKYSQAIPAFERFLEIHPRDPLADTAEVQLWLSRIERHASGATPDWKSALKELSGFINVRRDQDGFEELRDVIRKRAETIATGAAAAAGPAHDRELLTVSDDAVNLLTAYASQSTPPTDALKRIETSRRGSEASILKYEAFTGAVAEMDAALKARQTLAALAARRRLLGRYPEFARDATMAAKLDETLRIERSLVSSDDEGVDAITDDHEAAFSPPLALAFHARSRTDEVSVGGVVFGIAKETCYAVDSITGEPVWRRVIGWDAPFFPVPVTVPVPALLVFDTHHHELQLLEQSTGRLLWRQPAVSAVSGQPLIDEGQVFAVCANGVLAKVDLATGRLISQLKFSQPISAAAALNDGARLVVCGDQEVVYTLTRRPLECAAVSHLGHKPQGVAAPLLPMGALVLVAENQPNERTTLHVLDSRSSDDRLKQAATQSVPGHVVDVPVIRGRDLFVPSSGERISAFTVSDEPGQPPLTAGPRYESEGGGRSPMFLATGPDRQVWMASRTLRKLRLTADAVDPGQQFVNVGIASQPLQQLGKRIYVGRTLPYSSAVTVFQADRDQLISQWQTVVGGRLLAAAGSGQGAFVAVAETGDVFRISPASLVNGGFLKETTVRLKLSEGMTRSLEGIAMADGKLAIWCGNPEPQLWIVNRLGQVERTLTLPGELEAPPTRLGPRLALPLSGRIHLVADGPSLPAIQDFTLPQNESGPSTWRQVSSVDDDALIAGTASGQLRLLRPQETPQPYLALAASLDLGAPLDYRFAVGPTGIGVAAGERLRLINTTDLEPVAETTLGGAVSNDVWISGRLVFVETDRAHLHCFDADAALERMWSAPLPHSSLAGAPHLADNGRSVVIALRDGTVMHLNGEDGQIVQNQSAGQTLSGGPLAMDAAVVVATEDGCLLRVESILD
ncbi:MAG: PQQ-binding-like beta-propeller repeat protein, partial [Planctomycetaceae bacterium]|nr:PQQ-binding-like beta-propeller repeat protein [Planctomycetaceae bacterium]